MYDPMKHHCRSIQLKGKDYSEPGYYFVTICVNDRVELFGSIYRQRMILNDFGIIARDEWLRTSEIRRNVDTDEFVVMPNHLHGILVIKDSAGKVTMHRAATVGKQSEKVGKPTTNSIPTIVRSFKASVTRKINQINNQPGDQIWQRNYFERVIRDDQELEKTRIYIKSNPQNWWFDELNKP